MSTRWRMRQVAPGVVLGIALAFGPAGARAQTVAAEPQLPKEGGQPVAPTTGGAAGVQGPFAGGVPAGERVPGVLRLSLADAVKRGLARNLGVILARENARAAAGGRWLSLGGVLPEAGVLVSQARGKINEEEYGFPVAPGESPVLGPFDVMAAHLTAVVPVFDYAAIERARAGNDTLRAATHSARDARELVVSVTANLYLQAVTAASRIAAARSQLETARALHDRAVAQKQAGVVAGIEVLRAKVQLQSQQQRLIYYENELAKQKLGLARAIGVPLGQQIELTDPVPYKPLTGMTLDAALAEAWQGREDLQGALALVEGAEAARRSARGEVLPSVSVSADYGRSSKAWDTLHNTYTVQASVHVPILQAGRVRGQVLEADAQLGGQRAQLEDLRARIEYEVRAALLDLQAADERVQVARSAADLADQQLAQAQDRFTAGVSSNIEVVQAQETVATATDNYLSALHAHNAAKIALARAVGRSEERVEQYLEGAK